jgi:hypothetical protein
MSVSPNPDVRNHKHWSKGTQIYLSTFFRLVNNARPSHNRNPEHQFSMLNRKQKLEVHIDFEPPLKWPLWFLNHEAFDTPELAPISQPLKDSSWFVNSYFAANTEWCDRASQFVFRDKQSFDGFNLLAHSLSTRLIDELGGEFEVKAVIASLNKSGHVVFSLNKYNRIPAIEWIEHACNISRIRR